MFHILTLSGGEPWFTHAPPALEVSGSPAFVGLRMVLWLTSREGAQDLTRPIEESSGTSGTSCQLSEVVFFGGKGDMIMDG